LEVLMSADAIVPLDRFIVIEPEAPVRHDPRALLGRAFGLAQRECRAIVDRRQAAPEQDLAPEFQLLRRLVAGIYAPCRAQRPESRLIMREPRRLPLLAVPLQPEPCEIGANRVDELLAAAPGVGVVDPQQE